MGQFNYPHGHGFHYAHNWYPRHQAFGPPPIPNAVPPPPPPPPPPPHDQYFHHAYNGYPPYQALTPIAPATVPPLPYTWDFHYTDNGYPPHQALRPTVPTVVPPLPHNRDFHYANNGYPPHQGQQPTIPAAIPPHQTPEPTIPAIVSPQKTLEPTIPDVVPIQQLPRNLVCEICDVFFPRRQMEEHKNGKRHRRKVQQQIEYTRRQKTSNGHEAIHTPLDNAGAKDRGFKRNIGEAEVAKGKYMKMNNEIRKPMKSSKPEVNALSISVKSLVQAPELTPSSKGKEHHEIQNPIVEKNDQNQSTPMELRASVVSNVSSGTEDMSCDFAAIAVAQPEKHDLQTEMLEDKDHNEIQRKTVVSNDLQQLISVELHALTSSNINKQTEDANSDSLAIEIEPESFTQPQAVGLSFEPQTELVLDTEMEHQVSDAIACCESEHPAKETDFQMLPSVVMELDVPSRVAANTQTVGGSYKDEAKMNVLATELSQVSVCLKCGDEGFEEALVYCNGCQIYALHRYCLDGPVVINGDVTWFCEDCKETVADISSQNPCSLIPLERSDHENSAKDASQATNCIEREKTNKQQNQHIAAEDIDPQPIADPIWRGSLHLSNQSFGTVTGLVAHVSSLACSKVLEEARLFPHVLCASLLQRSAVWPKSFKEFGPDHQSIALYFFPETERAERAFDSLVDDMITKDLAITTMVENAELLIFPSTALPIQYRRFLVKYYLWGVFRAKKPSPKASHVVPEEDISAIINSSPSNTLRISGSPGSSSASNH